MVWSRSVGGEDGSSIMRCRSRAFTSSRRAVSDRNAKNRSQLLSAVAGSQVGPGTTKDLSGSWLGKLS
jgi:hypothetical protein